MERLLLVRYGEIFLKGLNRPFFEKLQVQRTSEALGGYPGVRVTKSEGRLYVAGYAEGDEPGVIGRVREVFGLHSVCPAVKTDKDFETVCETAARCLKEAFLKGGATFKVEARRADKRYPMNSMEIAREAGAYLLEHVDGAKVDIHNPDVVVNIEIRDAAYCYAEIIPCAGGMPVGSNGRAMLLLSGGIDSPVAGYMVAKRGVELTAVHYHSFPYTGEKARQKVIDLTKLLSRSAGKIRLHVVHFTDIQTEIYQKCPEEELTIIMRRFMMRIAEKLAREEGALSLVTGESIGQVASQTMQSLYVTDSVVGMPVFRPVIGMDKIEIMDYARRIGTYDTSILPYEDCCTVFVAKHPVTKPHLKFIERSESVLDAEGLIEAALQKSETIEIEP
jgi:thiamine biosynthesis protein ThiI